MCLSFHLDRPDILILDEAALAGKRAGVEVAASVKTQKLLMALFHGKAGRGEVLEDSLTGYFSHRSS